MANSALKSFNRRPPARKNSSSTISSNDAEEQYNEHRRAQISPSDGSVPSSMLNSFIARNPMTFNMVNSRDIKIGEQTTNIYNNCFTQVMFRLKPHTLHRVFHNGLSFQIAKTPLLFWTTQVWAFVKNFSSSLALGGAGAWSSWCCCCVAWGSSCIYSCWVRRLKSCLSLETDGALVSLPGYKRSQRCHLLERSLQKPETNQELVLIW